VLRQMVPKDKNQNLMTKRPPVSKTPLRKGGEGRGPHFS
jgi:hypothetical protein